MKSLNQNQINKVLIAIIFVIISLMIYSRITEQKRVDYYICYEELSHMTSTPNLEAIKDFCKERND